MKKLFMVGVLLFVIGSLTYANDITSFIGDPMVVNLKESTVECIEIITSRSKFRIYKCGKIEKLEWKEIHANEDDATLGTITFTDGTESNSLLYTVD